MKIDGLMLIILCLVIFVFYLVKNPSNTETFINACQYYNQNQPVYGYSNKLESQVGTAGLDLMHEKIDNPSKRAGWIRNPEPRYQYQCTVDKHLNRKCWWKPIYTSFYTDLRGEQKI